MSKFAMPSFSNSASSSETSRGLCEPWLNLALRLQKEALQDSRAGIITITVMVDRGGLPITWLEPQKQRFEPYATGLNRLLSLLATPLEIPSPSETPLDPPLDPPPSRTNLPPNPL